MDKPSATPEWPFRSLLFIPANKSDWIRKSPRFAADAIIMDLEDAVPPEQKKSARDSAREGAQFLRTQGIGALVRVNALADGGIDDVLGVMCAGLDAVVLPKLDNVRQIQELADVLSYAEGRAGLAHGSVGIMALPETAAAMCDARAIAAASPRVKSIMGALTDRFDETVVFNGDIATAAGYRPTAEGPEQLYLASKMVLDARAGGASHPVCTLLGTRIGDESGTRKLAMRARDLGYSGAACVHPGQVAVVNELFRPTRNECDFAQGVLDALADAQTKGLWAVNFRGIMIDQASVERARGTLAEAKRYGIV